MAAGSVRPANSMSRGLHAGQAEEGYCALRNTIVEQYHSVGRTGHLRGNALRLALTEILGVLESGEALGIERDRAPDGETTPSTVSRQFGRSRRGSSSRSRVRRNALGIPGRRAFANSLLARLDVRTVAHRFLESLVVEVGETAGLRCPAISMRSPLTSSPQRRIQGVAHRSAVDRARTAAGKVMLAFTGMSSAPGRHSPAEHRWTHHGSRCTRDRARVDFGHGWPGRRSASPS